MSESPVSSPSSEEDASVENSTPVKKPFLHPLRVIFSSVLLTVWCLLMLFIHLCWRLLHIPKIEKCYFVFHRGCCYLFNLHCKVKGQLSAARPTLFLSNHVSYLDVFVLGRYVPAFFIAKSEVSGWPVFGWLVKRQNTLFFERNSKKVCHQMAIMSAHFNKQNNLILFPEGTSTDGVHVKAFKSSLLQSVESADREVMIQPITLAYTRYQNKMMSHKIRDQYAWYAKMPFVSHFFSVLGMGRAEVELIFHQPVTLADFESRKDCAQYCQNQVSLGLADALRESH